MANSRWLLIALPFLLASEGCITTVSDRSPFNSYVGKSFITQRDAFLYTDTAWENNSEAWFSPPHKVLYLGEARIPASDYRRKAQVAFISKGQPIKVIEVRQEVGDGGVSYEALGEIFVPQWKKFVRFRYSWGYDKKLERAPWEPDATPAIRPLL